MRADYRDATSALRARVTSLEAELAEVEAAIGGQLEVRDRLNAEARALETSLERSGDGSALAKALGRVLLAALVAPAAGGLGMILTLVVAGLLGALVVVFGLIGAAYALLELWA